MVVRLIRVGNNPGFWKVGVENTLWWLVAKFLLVEAVPEANEAFGTDQICLGVEALI